MGDDRAQSADSINSRILTIPEILKRKYHNDQERKRYHNFTEEQREHHRKLCRESYRRRVTQKRSYYLLHKKHIDAYHHEYYRKNKEKYKKYGIIRETKNRKQYSYRIYSAMSRAIRRSFSDGVGGRKWEQLVGYTYSELKSHLQSQFTTEMTWENYGTYWQIDHIIPRSHFDFTTTEDWQFKTCWMLSNLRPLEAKENLRKSNKVARS